MADNVQLLWAKVLHVSQLTKQGFSVSNLKRPRLPLCYLAEPNPRCVEA